jgi:primosomal protein N' (replication factor Y)
MPEFCDVALPVPLEAVFTYRINGTQPVVGGRVLVPFRAQRLTGIVTALHDSPPDVEGISLKRVLHVLDSAPLLDPTLIKLGEWISEYYLAPLGEVFRSMLPLGAEVRRAQQYRITELGLQALYEGANRGSSLRSRRSPAEQQIEYSVLDRLSDGEPQRAAALKAATGARRELLAGMARKKWIAIEDVSAPANARRMARIAVLQPVGEAGKKLTTGQQSVIDRLREKNGRASVDELRAAGISLSSLSTLTKRGMVAIIQEPAALAAPALPARNKSPLAFLLNDAQRKALATITAATQTGFSAALMHGVTGSGKTAVYLSAMRDVLEQGRSALLLVPEIGLTPAMAADVAQVFGDKVSILHSALTDGERAEHWHRIRRGDARIVVGTRSAVFAPLQDLALIIVDEEHDGSYKQQETPRYHARDVAIMRGKLSGAAVVLGSATPSLESWNNAAGHNAQKAKYSLIEMPDRVERRPLPQVEIVDMRAEFAATGSDQVISRALEDALRERLARGEQSMILLNRRGYSPVVLCRSCGESVQCRDCAIALTHHLRKNALECHYCGYRRPVPQTCPKCGAEYLHFLGTGSEKLEELLHGQFPQARIARLDRDTVRGRDDFERVLNRLHAGEVDILVGTQMIAKGHDVHGVTLVGIVGADLALGFPDFRSAERTFQLITQVAGRAGRGETSGQVILQTYFPEHYCMQFAAVHDYSGFCEKELRFRSWMHYPPFTALANVVVRSDKVDEALAGAGVLGKWFAANRHSSVRVLGPAAAPIARLKRDYRYHFVLKSASRSALHNTLRAMLHHAAEKNIPRTQVIVDVDALSLS